jgi:uncharacterized protein YrzB (UPF0473 family)
MDNRSDIPFEPGDIIALSEEGEDESQAIDYKVLSILHIDDRVYVVLTPDIEQKVEEVEIHIVRYDYSDVLQPIESDEEWRKVENALEFMLQE